MSTAIEILRLLTEKPPPKWKPNRRAQLTSEQGRLLAVLADEWLEQGTRGGQLLAERLSGTITDARCAELGFETWLGISSIHRLVLFLMPDAVFEELAAAKDEVLAFRLVTWLKTERSTSALHGLVAARALRALEKVASGEDTPPIHSEPYADRYPLGELTVEFGREDRELFGVMTLIDKEHYEIDVDALMEGPLAALKEYRPPGARYVAWQSYDGEW